MTKAREEEIARIIDPERCPKCNANFDGGAIPESIRQHYSPPYRWSRKIGISDGEDIFAWKCPDCNHDWLAAPKGEVG
jgi:predicted Zn-ribbon and HTH transcriptional regulator